MIDPSFDASAAPSIQNAQAPIIPTPHLLPMQFTGSGSEYFRIWIVNLLLTIVTLTLYVPWARARKLRYFMANTLVGGQPLGFHGNPRQMFKGYLLICAFVILYSVAGNLSPIAGLVALAAGTLLWPALFKSSLQFRLSNTSWRGLRFAFHGSLGGAYRAMLPLLIPGAILVGGQHFVMDPAHPPVWFGVFAGLIALSTVAIAPWLFWNIKQYQHNHYALGNLQTEFKAGAGSFYLLTLKVIGLGLALVILPTALVGAVGYGLMSGLNLGKPGIGWALAGGVAYGVIVLVAMLCIRPYATSRLQNLVWTQTGNKQLRFVSELRFGSLMWLSVKNSFLTIITLGLYWPFAAVSMTRLRLEAVQVKTRISPDQLVGAAQIHNNETVGDAAGDFFGLDVGL
ncbi:MAG: YjgN family protein [Rhodoferax sp.]|nr:YjgN family protein [Rhodoferax sp.]